MYVVNTVFLSLPLSPTLYGRCQNLLKFGETKNVFTRRPIIDDFSSSAGVWKLIWFHVLTQTAAITNLLAFGGFFIYSTNVISEY